jgi:hypothetical protein
MFQVFTCEGHFILGFSGLPYITYMVSKEGRGQARGCKAVIPATLVAEIGRITVGDQPEPKVSEIPISTNKLGMVVQTCNLR